jgi:NADH-quinone oxidoreductase subunit A
MNTAIEFVPVLLMLGFGIFLALVISLLTHIIGKKRLNPVKLEVFECGIPLLTTGRMRFAIHFYLVAILFLIFDLETVVILPWAIVFKSLVAEYDWQMPLISLLVFLFILIVGLVYEVKKGAMKWE